MKLVIPVETLRWICARATASFFLLTTRMFLYYNQGLWTGQRLVAFKYCESRITMIDSSVFKPNWVSAPGDTMADILDERNLSAAEFAAQMRQTPKKIDDLFRGKAMITIEMARKLESVLGGSAGFWMIRDSQYREDIARLQGKGTELEDANWLSELPVKDMVKFGWIGPITSSSSALSECLHFFGVPDVTTWRDHYRNVSEMAAFRTSSSFESKLGSVAAWLRQAELEGLAIQTRNWNPKQFQLELANIRPLTRKKDPRVFIPQLIDLCAKCGVAVVIIRAPDGCRASGATRFLSPNRALLVLSFRYLSDDHFWFSFFHETGHLLLHGKKTLFLEGSNMPSTKEEEEANEFAAQALIPQEFQVELRNIPLSSHSVIRFARRVGICPGIVVGQLQHIGRLERRQLNKLKRRFSWTA